MGAQSPSADQTVTPLTGTDMTDATQTTYAEHITARRRAIDAALESCAYDAVLIHSGHIETYFADDQGIAFRATPHFLHWLPLAEPDHFLLLRRGERPRLLFRVRRDYWYEQAPLGTPFWAPHFDVDEITEQATAAHWLPPHPAAAFIGADHGVAGSLGFDPAHINPPSLLAPLDWARSFKTPYEIACISAAAEAARPAHRAARDVFEQGGSELDIHHAYVRALGCTDDELPYPSIIALDAKGAILHYQGKRRQGGGNVLLIDSGASHRGYACDITRTYARASAPAAFRELLGAFETLQQGLCRRVRPGVDFVELQRAAEIEIGILLNASGILRVDAEEAARDALTRVFFPHGLGHFLGLQVHDVAGQQLAPQGGVRAPPDECPALRTTRVLEAGLVITIEPGIYFIDMLLDPQRNGSRRTAFDWDLVDALRPCGGIRIEDDVLVTATGHRNLTREAGA